jgi:flagellar assembly protein FliH
MSSKARRTSGGDGVEQFPWQAADASAVAMRYRSAPERSTPASPGEPASEPQRVAAIEQEAFVKGYAQGERAGLDAATTRGQAMLRRLGETLQELTQLRAEMIQRTERQVVQLAMAIAERMIHREVSLDRGLMCAMARVALDRLGEHASATIRLHPDDFAAVSAAQAADWQNEQVKVIPDSMVSRGGCLVQSDFGFMDVDVAAQFRELSRTLFEEDAPAPADALVTVAANAVRVR